MSDKCPYCGRTHEKDLTVFECEVCKTRHCAGQIVLKKEGTYNIYSHLTANGSKCGPCWSVLE